MILYWYKNWIDNIYLPTGDRVQAHAYQLLQKHTVFKADLSRPDLVLR